MAKGKDASKHGHTLPRTRITAEKFTGVVVAWKGKYGWIKPDEEIEHEKASTRNGSLFASLSDILDGSTELHPGAPCEFHICEDDSGLGAEEIIETGPPDPSAIPEEKGKSGPKGGGKLAGKAGGKAWGDDKGFGKAPTKAPTSAYSKGWSAPYGAKGKDSLGGAYTNGAKGKDSWGGAYTNGKGKDSYGGGKGSYDSFGKGKDDKGKSKGKGGKGHLLPRTRISAEKFQGTVTAWKGKYGWITPSEEIEHEKATARKGLFVSKADLEGGIEELTEGATVEFHLWEDESGLGAEEVIQY